MRRRYLTFEERGVLAGFKNRRMTFVRCRQSRDGGARFEALVPNWAGESASSHNDMIMPWTALPNWCPLEGYDRVLFDLITAQFERYDGYIDPILMHEIRLSADREHGDPNQREAATLELATAERDLQRSLLEVVALFGRHVAERVQRAGLADLSGNILFTLADKSPDELRQLVRIIATAVARNAGISGDTLRVRLDRTAEFASPICSLVTSDQMGTVGYLSRQFRRVEGLHDELRFFGRDQPIELQEDINLVCANTMTFMLYAHARAEILRRQVLDEKSYTSELEHQTLLRGVAEERIRISFALDGWAQHATNWIQSQGAGLQGQIAAIGCIMRDMPKPPMEVDEELTRVKHENGSMAFRAKQVRELHSWGTNELDMELYARVMAGREDGKVNA